MVSGESAYCENAIPPKSIVNYHLLIKLQPSCSDTYTYTIVKNEKINNVFWVDLFLRFLKMNSPRNVKLPPWYGQ